MKTLNESRGSRKSSWLSLLLVLVFLALNFLFPALELRWKLLAAVAAAAVTALVLYVWRKQHPPETEEEDPEDVKPPY